MTIPIETAGHAGLPYGPIGPMPTPSSSQTPESPSNGSGASGVPSGWLECDIATLKGLRIRTLALAKDASAYDTRLQRMFTDVEAEIRRALSALLLQREDQSEAQQLEHAAAIANSPICIYCGSTAHWSQDCQVTIVDSGVLA